AVILAQHGSGALDRVRGQLGTLLDELEQLVEEGLDQGRLLGRAGHGDLIAAHVNIAGPGELALYDVQELIAGAEQADHRMVRRDDDLDPLWTLWTLWALAVWRCCGVCQCCAIYLWWITRLTLAASSSGDRQARAHARAVRSGLRRRPC